MKKLLLLSCLFFVTLSGFATHLMGGQLTSRQLSGLTYEITLTLYRDTVGINIADSMNIEITHLVSGNTISFYTPHSGAVNFLNGVEEYTYIDTVTLPTIGYYEIYWTNCCRNGAILNLPNPLGNSFDIINYLTVDTIAGNSSPVFLNPPVILAQLNDTFYYNPLPFDSDGDSIAWSLDIPQDNGPIAGYVDPFADPAGPFTMNTLTGEITWIPNTLGHFVASFIVEEYRNGLKIGEIRRDMQYIVIDVPGNGNRAYIDTQNWPVDANNQFSFDVQINTPFNLVVMAFDADGDALTVDANGEPFIITNNATWTNLSSGAGFSTNQFSWNTTTSEMRNAPYVVVFRIFETHGNFVLVKDQTLMLKVGNFTSVNENINSTSIGNLYPVPSTGDLYIPVTIEKNSDIRISIVNQLGQEVRNIDKQLNAGQNLIYLNNLNLPGGVYFINVTVGGNNYLQKFILE